MGPKSHTIDPRIGGEVAALVRAAQPTVDAILSDSRGEVEATWIPGVADADDAPTVQLILTDDGTRFGEEFTGRDFADGVHFQRRVRRLWSDVLWDRIRRAREATHLRLLQPEEV